MDSDESYQNWLNSLSEEDEMALDGDTDLFTSQLNKEGRKALKDSGKELKTLMVSYNYMILKEEY